MARKSKYRTRDRRKTDPMICFYVDEVEQIYKNVIGEELRDRFDEWYQDWDKHLFTRANFRIFDRKKSRDGEPIDILLSYSIKGESVRFALFNKEGKSFEWSMHTGYCSPLKGEWDLRHKSLSGMENMPVWALDDTGDRVSKEHALVKQEIDSREARVSQIPDVEKLVRSAQQGNIPVMLAESLALERMGLNEELIKLHNKNLNIIYNGCLEALSFTVLFCLFYFHIRPPKSYSKPASTETSGGKKYQELLPSVNNLSPQAVIRPKNGTKLYFKRTWTRRTESWHVRGHLRRYKSGKEIWVKPHVKGSGENVKKSVYVNEARKDAYAESPPNHHI